MERPPTVINMVVDVTSNNSIIQLPYTVEGKIGSINLTAWNMDPNTLPYIQLKFGDGIRVETACHGTAGTIMPDCIQVPLPGVNAVIGFPRGISICTNRKLPRVFNLSLYGSNAVPLTITRLVLWFEIRLNEW